MAYLSFSLDADPETRHSSFLQLTRNIDTTNFDDHFGLDVQVLAFIDFLKAQGFSDSDINEALAYTA